MSQVQYTNRRWVVVAKEASYGVAPTFDPSTDALAVRSISFTPLQANTESEQRIKPYFGKSREIITSRYASVSLEVDLAGSGVVGNAPVWGRIWEACNNNETVNTGVDVSYLPWTRSPHTVAIQVVVDGNLHLLTGCHGTWSLNLTAQAIPYLSFEMTGIYNDVVANTTAAGQYSQPSAVAAMTSTVTNFEFLGISPIVRSLEINSGINVVTRDLIGESSVKITDRMMTADLVVQAPPVSDVDYFAAALAEGTTSLSLTHGTQPGNIVKIDMPKVDLGAPNYNDEDGIQMLQLPLSLMPDAGDDEIKITLE